MPEIHRVEKVQIALTQNSTTFLELQQLYMSYGNTATHVTHITYVHTKNNNVSQ